MALARRWREGPALLGVLWPVLTALTVFLATPLDWQRYYLPLHPGIALVAAAGVAWLAQRIAGWERTGERAAHVVD